MIDSIVDLMSLKLSPLSPAVVLTTNDMSNLGNLVVPKINKKQTDNHKLIHNLKNKYLSEKLCSTHYDKINFKSKLLYT